MRLHQLTDLARLDPLGLRVFVEPCRQTFGEAAGVAEDDRAAVGEDELDDLGVDRGPDAGAGGVQRAGARTGDGLGLAEFAHVLDRDDDLDLQRLANTCIDDADRPGRPLGQETAEEARHFLERSLGRREPDALRRPSSDLLQPFEREREVSAAFGGREGMDLVDDHGLDADERGRRRRREHQVQALGRGDQQIRRTADQLLAFLGAGVTGAQTDDRLHVGHPDALSGQFDPLQWRPQVLLDIEREGAQRRDVEHSGAVFLRRRRRGHEAVDGGQERSQRLA